jgi:hypothetical protein
MGPHPGFNPFFQQQFESGLPSVRASTSQDPLTKKRATPATPASQSRPSTQDPYFTAEGDNMEANGQQDDTTDNPTQTMNSQNLPSQDASTHDTLPNTEEATKLPFLAKRTKMTNSPLDSTEDMEDTPLRGNRPIRNFVDPNHLIRRQLQYDSPENVQQQALPSPDPPTSLKEAPTGDNTQHHRSRLGSTEPQGGHSR